MSPLWLAPYVLFFATLAETTAVSPRPEGCRVFNAVREGPLKLPCSGVSGCLATRGIWFNTSADTREEIDPELGIIDRTTGELLVTESASSDVGGQKYECQCGAESICYKIHIPPQVSITLTPQDVAVGENVTVRCTSYGGYPQPATIMLTNSSGIMSLRNGDPYVFPIRRLEDGGKLMCIVHDVATQIIMSATLNVYSKPHIAKVENTTIVSGSGFNTATISCSVHSTHCQTVVKFFKDESEIRDSEEKLTQVNRVPKGNHTFTHYLIFSDVSEEDVGRYTCRVYANYSRLVPVADKELFVHSYSPSSDNGEASTDNSGCDCVDRDVLIGSIVANIVLCVVLMITIVGVLLGVYLMESQHH